MIVKRYLGYESPALVTEGRLLMRRYLYNSTMRNARDTVVVATLAGLTVLVAACGQQSAPSPSHFTPASQLPGSLSVLRSQQGDFLESGVSGFKSSLKMERGFPVVVTKWASWCGPCRYELPTLATAAQRLSKSVAFIGDNYQDSQDPAASLLARTPLPYPSFSDRDGSISREFTDTTFLPATAIYDSKGNLRTVHFGPYQDASELIAEVRKFTG